MALGSWPTVTDDDGSYTVGTVYNKALTDAIKASIEASVFSTTNPSLSPADIIDEVVTARGSKASLGARLDVSINDDGTLKAIAGQASTTQLASQMGQGNWVGNDTFLIWSQGDALAPDYWTLNNLTIARETSTVKIGPMGVKLTRAGADGGLYQDLMNTTSFTNFGSYYKERTFGFGCWVYTSVASIARLKVSDGVTTTTTSYHTGGGGWEWISGTHTVSATATFLRMMLQMLNSSGDAYFCGPTFIESTLAPSGWFPCHTVIGTVVWKSSGDASTGTDIGDRFGYHRPFRVEDTHIYAATAPTGADLKIDVNIYDGAAWQSMYTTKPQIDAGDSRSDKAVPDGTYQYRCVGAQVGDVVDDVEINWDIDQVGSGTAGADLMVKIRCLIYVRAQEGMLDLEDS
jgi:hypothetical protein